MSGQEPKHAYFGQALDDALLTRIIPGRLLMSASAAVVAYADKIAEARSRGATWKEISDAFKRARIQAEPKTLSNLYVLHGKNKDSSPSISTRRPPKIFRVASSADDRKTFGIDQTSVLEALMPLARAAFAKGANKTELAKLFRAAGVSCSRKTFTDIGKHQE